VRGLTCGEIVGRGATSTVWTAVRDDTGERVAVKVTSPERLHVGQLMELAARETAILARVASEHVVRLHEAHPLPDGSVAVVLDLADGGSLADLVGARGRLTEGEAATIGTAIATALSTLHEAGVIHGDLSPGNVLFSADGKPMLADFEASRVAGESHPPLVAGTPGFVAPEVVDGDVPTEASDVYGLAGLLWFALTGRNLAADSGMPSGRAAAPDRAEATRLVGPAFGAVLVPMLGEDPATRPGADEVALACFEAAAPSPVVLVRGARDPASALTRRMRGQARPPDVPAEQPAGTTSAAGRAGTGEAGRVTSRAEARGAARRGARLSVSVRVALLVVGMLFAAASVVLTQRHRSAADQSPTTASTTIATRSPSTSAGAGLQQDPVSVLNALVTARASALLGRDAAALAKADAPGSKLLGNDTAIVTDLAAANQAYADLAFQVRSAQWVSGDDTTAQVLAVIDQTAYRLVGPGTDVRTEPAKPGQPLRYRLVRTADGWRIADVTS
jgi:hypothetical protein